MSYDDRTMAPSDCRGSDGRTGRSAAALRRRVAMAALLSLAGCGGGASLSAISVVPAPAPTPAPTPTPVPTPTPSPSPTPTAASAKPVLRGLVTMGRSSQSPSTPPANDFAELAAHPAVYSGAVVDLFWSQLEPSQGEFDDSAIDAALAALTRYNAQYPAAPVVAKLRIFAGVGTPAWVIAATGAVTATDDQGQNFTAAKFWTTQYQGYWRGLQEHLAQRYDGQAMVGEVAISSCSSITAEPFIVPHNATALTALHAAGYTDAQDRACLAAAVQDYAAWQTTPLDYTFNTFFTTDAQPGADDPAFTIQVMDAFRAALGTRAVLANHGLQAPLKPGAVPIYAEFTNLYDQAAGHAPPMLSPLEFQTFSPTTDWPSAVALALTYHPTEIEVWDTVAAGGQAPLTQAQLQMWATALKG